VESYSHTEVIRAPRDLCYATLVDFACYPDWFGRISSADILSAEPAADRWEVRYGLDAVLKTISYTLAYRGTPPGTLQWTMTRGDLRAIEGRYDLVELEPGLTEATCTQALDIGLWVPGPVRRIFETSALEESVKEFKKAAEARAAG
jgi:hypothetical protein